MTSRIDDGRSRSMGLRITLVALAAALALGVPAERAAGASLTVDCVKSKLKTAARHAKKYAKCLSKYAKRPSQAELDACAAAVDADALSRINETTLDIILEGGTCGTSADELRLTGDDAWLAEFAAKDLLVPGNVLPDKCVAKKLGAIGKYASSATKCVLKDYLRHDPARRATCQRKASDKLAKSYLGASRRGPCQSTVASTTGGIVGARVAEQLEVLRFGNRIIESPVTGTFTTAPTLGVSGRMLGAEQLSELTLNGVSLLPLDSNNTFSATATMDPEAIINPITAELTPTGGDVRRHRVSVIAGDGVNTGFVLDGDLSPQSIGMRMNESGLDSLTPIISDLSGDALDISDLLTAQNPVLDDQCVSEVLGLCAYWATVNVTDVGFGNFGIAIDPRASGVTDLDVTIDNFYVGIDLHVHDAALVQFDCGLDITADSVTISSSYDMVPMAGMPSKVDVNQVSPVDISFDNFSHNFTSGVCDAPIIGDIIDLIVSGMIEDMVRNGFADGLADPDGAGPADSPIADGIEGALDGIDIAGPVGDAIGVTLNAEFDSISEDEDGITFVVNAGVTAAQLAPGAPDLPASYTVAEPFPTYGATTPGGLPYGIGLGLSTSAFNQLLKAEVETGLLQATLTEIDLGTGPTPLTVGLLKLFIPQLAQFASSEPIIIEVVPKLAPIFTGKQGPGGELAELMIGHLEVNMRLESSGYLVLGMAVDASVGVDLTIGPGGIGFSLATPSTDDIHIDILNNPLGADEAAMQSLLQSLLPTFFPQLAGALEGLPLPSFLGLQLAPVEVARQGDFLTIYTDLTLGP